MSDPRPGIYLDGVEQITPTVPVAGIDSTAIHDNVAGEINAVSTKGTLTGNELVLIESVADSNAKRKTTTQDIADLGGGGGGASIFDATVGASGADYTTVALALADSKVSLLMIDDTTESSSPAVPSTGFYLYIPQGVTWILGNNNCTYSAAADVYIESDGGEIDYTFTSGKRIFANASYSTSLTRVDGVFFDNNSNAGNTYLSDGIEHVTNCSWSLVAGWVKACIFSNVKGCIYDNLNIEGSNSKEEQFVLLQGGRATNIVFDGTFTTTANKYTVWIHNDSSLVSFYYMGSTSGFAMWADGYSGMSNINAIQGTNSIRIGRTSDSTLSDCGVGGGTLDVTASDFSSIMGVRSIGTLDFTDAGATNNMVSNCKATAALTVAGDRNKFVNCDFIGGGSVSSGADNNGFVNCQFGADAGGGALTLTIVAGSNNTRVVSCMTDAAISDSGTGTVTAANVVY
jgi:hypothetical protein